MRHLMGDLAREVLFKLDTRTGDADDYIAYDETEVAAIIEQAARLRKLRESTPEVHVFEEYREGYPDHVRAHSLKGGSILSSFEDILEGEK